MKTCTNCGNQVRETDNFCPNCGQRLKTEQDTEIQSQILQMKICDLCGEENPVDAEECSYCGVGFTGKEKIIEKEFIQSKKKSIEIDEKNVKFKSARSPEHFKKKKITQKKEDRQTKTLETKHFLIIGILVVVIGSILILYNSNSTKTGMQNPQQETQSRFDLNALNEINQLENELKNDPDNQQKLLRIANLNHDAGFFEKAIGYYERYLKLNPADNDAEVDMGVCYFELKQYDKASSIFENVIKKNPRHQIAFLNLGIVTLTKGDVEKAKEYFKKCVELGEHTDAGHRAAELLKSH